ncbi:MAG: (deoxy)nucleoside triphosphate pyrophosphohydrolase [Spirochaetia bacterium]
MTISTAGVAEKDGRFLVALRRPGTSIGEKWEFPGGKVDEGESPKEALQREFREEFSVDVRVGELMCTGTFKNRQAEYRLQGYRVHVISDSFLLKEHQKIRWCTVSELQDLPMAESDKIILRCIEHEYKESSESEAPE